MLIPARTLDTILFFSDQGKVYSEKAYQLPDAGRTSTGIPIVNILSLNAGERITAAVPVPNFEAAEYCTMLTLHGRMKRISLSEFASVRPSGLIAISLDDHDELGWVRLTSGKDDLLLVTAQGQALRISEEDIRSMGRQAGGVTGINLRSGDVLASLEVVQPNGSLLIVTENGYGKRVNLVEYPQKSRATGGVVTIDQKNINKTGKIVAARVVQESDEVTMISTAGIVLRLKVKEIGMLGRGTRGVRLMDLSKTDTVASVARIPATGNSNGN